MNHQSTDAWQPFGNFVPIQLLSSTIVQSQNYILLWKHENYTNISKMKITKSEETTEIFVDVFFSVFSWQWFLFEWKEGEKSEKESEVKSQSWFSIFWCNGKRPTKMPENFSKSLSAKKMQNRMIWQSFCMLKHHSTII